MKVHHSATSRTAEIGDPNNGLAEPRSARLVKLTLWVSVLASLVAGFSQIPSRDTWMDEIWSMFLSDPEPPLSVLAHERWAYDSHPPLFMWMARMYRGLVPDEIVFARLTNVIALVPAGIYFAWLWRASPDWRVVLTLFLAVFCSGFLVVHYPAEFRVYFPLMLASAVYAFASLRVVAAAVERRPIARGDAVALPVAGVLLLTFHVLDVPFVIGHAVVMALLLWREGGVAIARALRPHAIALVAALVVMATYYGTIANFEQGTTAGGSWIPRTKFAWSGYLAAKWSVMMAPGLVAAALWFGPLRGRGFARAVASDRGMALGLLALALSIAGFVGLMLAVNTRTPIMIDRYFSVLAGPLALLLAGGAAIGLRSLPAGWQRAALVGVMLNSVAVTGWFYMTESRVWNGGLYYTASLEAAKALHARCDRPLYHATDNRLRYATYQEQLGDWTARYLAPKVGVTMKAATADVPIIVSADCPVAFWVPFHSRRGAPGTIEAIVAEHGLRIEGAPVEALELESQGLPAIVRLRR